MHVITLSQLSINPHYSTLFLSTNYINALQSWQYYLNPEYYSAACHTVLAPSLRRYFQNRVSHETHFSLSCLRARSTLLQNVGFLRTKRTDSNIYVQGTVNNLFFLNVALHFPYDPNTNTYFLCNQYSRPGITPEHYVVPYD